MVVRRSISSVCVGTLIVNFSLYQDLLNALLIPFALSANVIILFSPESCDNNLMLLHSD